MFSLGLEPVRNTDVNQNDMDRYYWRIGHRWSGDSPRDRRRAKPKTLATRTLIFLAAAFAVTQLALFLIR